MLLVHTSLEYLSGNSWTNIVRFAGSKRGGAATKLRRSTVAVLQVLRRGVWVDADNPSDLV
jgi:hypothetical protein